MNILLKLLFNTYVKSISSFVYLILAIVSLATLNYFYKVNEKIIYQFNYSIIINSIQDYQSSNYEFISNQSIFGIVINHHKDYIKTNDVKLILEASNKRFDIKNIHSDKLKLYSEKSNTLTEEVFINYLESLEESFEERIRESFKTSNQINDFISEQSKLFFYNLINDLDQSDLLNDQLSLRYNVPLTNSELNLSYGNNLIYDKFNNLKQFNIDELEALKINFPVSFKTDNNDYTYETKFISNKTTKNKIILSIIIISILLMLLHPIIMQKLNDIVSEAR